MYVSARIGIALSTTEYERPEDVLRDAEIALHRAKLRGSKTYEVFDTHMHARAVARLHLETGAAGRRVSGAVCLLSTHYRLCERSYLRL